MIEVYAVARSLGLPDDETDRWLDSEIAESGTAPRDMIADGRAHEVIHMLETMHAIA